MFNNTLGRTIRLGIKSLLLHKLRSLLTTLGVLFGVSSVIAMLAIGEGASAEAQEQIKLLGSQNIILRSVKPPDDLVSNESSRLIAYGLLHADYNRVAESFPWVESAVPVRELAEEVRYKDRVLPSPRLLSTVPGYLDSTGRRLTDGRFLSEQDEQRVNNVVVIGYEVARELFPTESAVGKSLKIGPEYFGVIGVIMPRTPIGQNQPNAGENTTAELFIPMSTGSKWFGDISVKIRSGSREMEMVELHEIVARIDTAEHVPIAAAAARTMLKRNHKKVDYEVIVPLEQLAIAEETKRIFNIVLGSIAGISLLVGGIGIMNVMLATVTERTREIGIRRALGAKRKHIVLQFLVETVVLSVGGGLVGIALGLLIPWVVETYADLPTIVTPAAPILAFGISVSIGLLFGLYPAWRAANMDPVDALRHE